MPVLRPAAHKHRNDKSFLLQFALNITSQCGEDGILRKVFEYIGVEKAQGLCVDVGAWDGRHLSNTYSLIHGTLSLPWAAVLIEANPQRAAEMRELYATREDVKCLCALVGAVGESALDNLLGAQHVPEHFELLCIDVDGNDYHLWESVKHYQPRVVVVEFSTCSKQCYHMCFDAAHTDNDARIHQGSSLAALVELGQSKSYTLVATTTFNAIFVRDSDVHKLPHFDRSIDALHRPSMCTDVFQLYDGTLVFTGCKKLLWHRVALDEKKLQVLPPHQRKFPFAPPASDEIMQLREKVCACAAIAGAATVDATELFASLMITLNAVLASMLIPAVEQASLELLCDVLALSTRCDIDTLLLEERAAEALILAGDNALSHGQRATARAWYERAVSVLGTQSILCTHEQRQQRRNRVLVSTCAKLCHICSKQQLWLEAKHWLRAAARESCTTCADDTVLKATVRFKALSAKHTEQRFATWPSLQKETFCNAIAQCSLCLEKRCNCASPHAKRATWAQLWVLMCMLVFIVGAVLTVRR